jgi:hypothetical protein
MRISGKVNKYDVGFLEMQTEKLGAIPSNNYLVGRVRRNLLSSSWIGALSRIGTPACRATITASTAPMRTSNFKTNSKLTGTSSRATRRQIRRESGEAAQSAWKDDELTINGEYNEVQPNFNPEVGFVRRPNLAQYVARCLETPSGWEQNIRTLNFGTSVDYNEGSASRRLETRIQRARWASASRTGGRSPSRR